jgi:hypothetical protein
LCTCLNQPSAMFPHLLATQALVQLIPFNSVMIPLLRMGGKVCHGVIYLACQQKLTIIQPAWLLLSLCHSGILGLFRLLA